MKKLVLLMMSVLLLASCVDSYEYWQTIRGKYPTQVIISNCSGSDIQQYVVIDTVKHTIRTVVMNYTHNRIQSDYLIQKY